MDDTEPTSDGQAPDGEQEPVACCAKPERDEVLQRVIDRLGRLIDQMDIARAEGQVVTGMMLHDLINTRCVLRHNLYLRKGDHVH